MGLETVKEEIIRNAKNQVDSLNIEARQESDKILKETEKKLEELNKISSEEIKKLTDTIKKQELASAELENKNFFLNTKKQLIDKVFAEVKEKLKSLNANKREAYLKKLIEKSKKEIEVAYVYCNKKDLNFLKGFKVEDVNFNRLFGPTKCWPVPNVKHPFVSLPIYSYISRVNPNTWNNFMLVINK